MIELSQWYQDALNKNERKRASDREVDRLTDRSVAEPNANTTTSDLPSTVTLGPHSFVLAKTSRPRGDVFRNCVVCNGTVIAEECIYQRSATYVRGFVTYDRERVTLDRWHRCSSEPGMDRDD